MSKKQSNLIHNNIIQRQHRDVYGKKMNTWNKSKLNSAIQKTNKSVCNPNMKNVTHLSNLNKVRECSEYIQINGKIIKNKLPDYITLRNVPFVQTFTANVHEALLNIISKYGKNRIIVGCVAWFNSNDIIEVLSENAKAVLFIVNNEDYEKWGFGSVNKEKFAKLPALKTTPANIWGKKVECELAISHNPVYSPVRAFGVASKEKKLVNASTMHSKFMVICDENDMPWALWSGTNNFTQKSKRNIENAFFFISADMGMQYFLNFSRTFVHSSDLIY